MQVLAAQNALPGLGAPRSLGYGLGPDFDETYLSPLSRDHGGMVPLEAIGYGNGLTKWNHDLLSQLRAGGVGRGLGPLGGSVDASPWARAGAYPGAGVDRGYRFPSSWPGLPYTGGAWGGAVGGYDARRMGMSGGSSGPPRFMDRISCDGGSRGRHGSFS